MLDVLSNPGAIKWPVSLWSCASLESFRFYNVSISFWKSWKQDMYTELFFLKWHASAYLSHSEIIMSKIETLPKQHQQAQIYRIGMQVSSNKLCWLYRVFNIGHEISHQGDTINKVKSRIPVEFCTGGILKVIRVVRKSSFSISPSKDNLLNT